MLYNLDDLVSMSNQIDLLQKYDFFTIYIYDNPSDLVGTRKFIKQMSVSDLNEKISIL